MPFPNIDPVIFQIGPFALRWYALAYILGLVGGWYYILHLLPRSPVLSANTRHAAQAGQDHASDVLDDLLLYMTLGVILGGRLGYVIFYNLPYYLNHPGQILAVWQGGMAFHGGLLGVIVATVIYARRRGLRILSLGDLICAAAPIGLFFGRISNFVNSELWGRPTDHPLGVIFPNGGPLPRHPSQLYEAALEGLVLFVLIRFLIVRYQALDRPGLVCGLFFTGYGISRMLVEQFFREPDAHIGYLVGGTTMGFWLSLPVLLIGLGFLSFAVKNSDVHSADGSSDDTQ